MKHILSLILGFGFFILFSQAQAETPHKGSLCQVKTYSNFLGPSCWEFPKQAHKTVWQLTIKNLSPAYKDHKGRTDYPTLCVATSGDSCYDGVSAEKDQVLTINVRDGQLVWFGSTFDDFADPERQVLIVAKIIHVAKVT